MECRRKGEYFSADVNRSGDRLRMPGILIFLTTVLVVAITNLLLPSIAYDPYDTDRFYIAWVFAMREADGLGALFAASYQNLRAPEPVPPLMLFFLDCLSLGFLSPRQLIAIPAALCLYLIASRVLRAGWVAGVAASLAICGYYSFTLATITYRLAFAFLFLTLFFTCLLRRGVASETLLLLACGSHFSIALMMPFIYVYFRVYEQINFSKLRFGVGAGVMGLAYIYALDSSMLLEVFTARTQEKVALSNIAIGWVSGLVILYLAALAFLNKYLFLMVIFAGYVSLFLIMGSSRFTMLVYLVAILIFLFRESAISRNHKMFFGGPLLIFGGYSCIKLWVLGF